MNRGTDEPDSLTPLLQDVREADVKVAVDRKSEEGWSADLGVAMDGDVAIATIYIHARRADLLESHLFGLDDRRSQLVAYDDTATIAKFRALFDKNPENQQRTALVKPFDDFESPEFPSQVRQWLIKFQWQLLALRWIHKAHHTPQSSIYNDPTQVFDNPGAVGNTTGTFLLRILHPFKADHSWVVQEKERLPKLTPKIWFAYCPKNGCLRTKES